LDGKHSPKDPPLIPHQVLRFLFEFICQKVFKTLFCRISLLGAKIEFPLVKHPLRSPRSHTYISINFCWTHCENSRIWRRTAYTGLTGAPHRSDRWRLTNPRSCFLHVFDPYLCRNASSSYFSISYCPSR
jgi:hypothetical protein